METAKAYIITGGPGVGKSSIIEELSKRGYYCFEEVSRNIIQDQNNKGEHALPWEDLESFAEMAFEKMCKQLNRIPQSGICFFDRAIPDLIAYLKRRQLEVPPYFYNTFKRAPYQRKVFFGPSWPDIYKNDPERPQTLADSCEISKYIWKSYNELGCELAILPKVNVEERVDFILKEC